MKWFRDTAYERLLQETIKFLREENARLTDTLIEMKREGFQFNPAPEIPEKQPMLPPDVMVAIHEVAEPHEQLYGEMVAYAQMLLDSSNEPLDVADMIRNGGDVSAFLS